jgi:hypothetical protein
VDSIRPKLSARDVSIVGSNSDAGRQKGTKITSSGVVFRFIRPSPVRYVAVHAAELPKMVPNGAPLDSSFSVPVHIDH